MKRYMLIVGGILSLFLGIIGIILPVLPTTPFFLLSAACFMKSSNKLYNWVINHKIFGSYIKNYILYKAISMKSKIISLVFLWSMILTSAFFFVTNIWIRVLLIIIAIGVSIHILTISTLTEEMILTSEKNPPYKG